MALLLGIYNKTEGAEPKLEETLLGIFSLHDKRKLKAVVAGKMKLWLTENGNGFTCHETDDYLNVYSGRIYNLNKDISCRSLNENEIQHLDGEFTWVSVDKIKPSALLCNDFWGLYPLYYTETTDCFVFCNEYEPLTALWDGIPDAAALAAYYAIGAVPGTATFMKNIRNLPPHTILTFNAGRVALSTIDKPPIPINRHLTVSEAAEHTALLFRNAVQKRAEILEAKCDVMLTGGADTRLILSCLNDRQRQKMPFVTYLTPPLTEAEDTDVCIARQLADTLSLHHQVRRYNLWDKPFGTDYFAYKRGIASEKYLSGHFGSELLKLELYKATDNNLLQYLSKDNSWLGNALKKRKLRQSTASVFPGPVLKELPSLDDLLARETALLAFCENRKLLFLLTLATRSFFTYTWKGTRSIYFDQPAYMPIIFVMPFLDKDLLLFLLSLPDEFLGSGHDKMYNLLFKNHFPELCNVQTNSPLANDPLAILKPVAEATVPFEYRKLDYSESYKNALNNNEFKNRYNSKFLGNIRRAYLSDQLNKFIDFETWCQYVTTY